MFSDARRCSSECCLLPSLPSLVIARIRLAWAAFATVREGCYDGALPNCLPPALEFVLHALGHFRYTHITIRVIVGFGLRVLRVIGVPHAFVLVAPHVLDMQRLLRGTSSWRNLAPAYDARLIFHEGRLRALTTSRVGYYVCSELF